MGSGIFTRKAGELIFHDKIQQSSIDLTRSSIGNRSNRSANKIIIVGIGEVTQFGIVLSHSDKQASNTQANNKARERKTHGGRRANKMARVKWGRGKQE